MKWFHLIGISGKTTANIAKVFQDMGWFVTGSDTQFFPPASNLLEEFKINTVEGYDYKHLTRDFWVSRVTGLESRDISEYPDLVLFISYLSNKNKEYLFAKKKGLDIKPYAKILGEYLIKPESVVVIGTAGKTTTTALLTYLLQKLNFDPSYMIGAEVVDIQDSLKITDSRFSVIEGDEYHNPDPEIEGKAKFLEYKPKYLVITSIGWEHQDIFPTQEKYIEEFAKAVELVPEDGLIIAHAGDENVDKALLGAKAKVIRYGIISSEEAGDRSQETGVRKQEPGNRSQWTVVKGNELNRIYDHNGNFVMEFKTKLLGDYNLENILAAVTLILNIPSHHFHVDIIREGTKNLEMIASAISEFSGVKKRLEKLYENEKVVIIDDFGVAPTRARNSLFTLKENYPEHKIVAVFEPNSGSRSKDSEQFSSMYDKAFDNADEVIIPDLSSPNNELVNTEEMIKRLRALGVEANHVANENLVEELISKIENSDSSVLIVFFSSYRLTEIAEELVKRLIKS